jgi:hypothetical protein
MNGWTLERRKKQADSIQRWKPWERSAGPKSDQGKSNCARNAYKGGIRPKLRRLARAMREQQRQLTAFVQ